MSPPKWLPLVLAALAVLPGASGEKSLASGWYYDGDSFKIKEDIVYVKFYGYWRPPDLDGTPNYTEYKRQYDDGNYDKQTNWWYIDRERNRLYLNRNDRGLVLQLGGCFDENLVQYCFKDIDWWDKSHGGQAKYEGGRLKPAINVEVKEMEATIQVTKTVSPTIVDKFEEAKVTTELKNIGTEPANPVTHAEVWPNTASIRNPSGLALSRNEVSWSGALNPGMSRTFTYYITPITDEAPRSAYNLSYAYKGRTVNQTGSLSLSVRTPITMTVGLSPATTGVEETTKLSMSVTNNDESADLGMDIRISIPSGLDLLSRFEGVLEEGSILRIRKALPKQGSFAFSMMLRGHYTGEYVIKTTALFDIRDEQIEKAFNSTYKIEQGKLTPILRFDAESVEGGQPVIVRALLLNNEPDQHLVNIEGGLVSDLFERPVSFTVPEVLAGSTKLVFDAPVATPITSQPASFLFNLTGTYHIASGEKFDFQTQKALQVKPVTGERFRIEQEADKASVAKGDNVTVFVRIENLKDVRAAKVAVADRLPPFAEVVGGLTSALMDFEPLQKRQAYIYRVKALPNATEPVLTITTNIIYQAYTAEQSLSINVTDPPTGEPIAEENATNETADETPQVQEPAPVPEEKKPGVFSRIWTGIKNFFKGLFGKKEASPPAEPAVEQPSPNQGPDSNAASPSDTSSNSTPS